MVSSIFYIIMTILIFVVIYVISLKQDIEDKDRVIRNMQVQQRKKDEEIKKKVFEEKWKTKKEDMIKEHNEKNISIDTNIGSHIIKF